MIDIKMCNLKSYDDAQFVAVVMNNYLKLSCKRQPCDISDSKSIFYIAKVNSMPVGICAFELNTPNSIELKHIVVFRENRGKGIAKHMINFMIDKINKDKYKHNHHKVYMTINKNNLSMIRLAEKLNFIKEGLLKNHYIQNSDIFVYAREI